jgi:hypothetical protein
MHVVAFTCFIFFRDSSAFAIFSENVFSSSDRVAFSFFPVKRQHVRAQTHKTQPKKLAIYYILCSSYCTSNFSLSSSNFENRSAENSTVLSQISQLKNEDN